jgi:hypothetical protein
MLLMLIGNAGLVTVISSLILTFVTADEQGSVWSSLGIVVGGSRPHLVGPA